MWEVYAKRWEYSYIRIMDIRECRSDLQPLPYRFPSDGFILMPGGEDVQGILDGACIMKEGPFLLHVEKGSTFDLRDRSGRRFYYLILYKSISVIPRLSRSNRLRARSWMDQAQRHGAAFIPSSPAKLYEQVRRMLDCWQQRSAPDRLLLKALFYQFVHEVQLQRLSASCGGERPIEAVIRYVNEHYKEAISLETLAEEFHYSSRHLSKLFKQETGQSVIQYIIAERMKQARHMLVHTQASIQDIACAVGYDDLFYFTRLFKKHVGLSPTKFQQRHGTGVNSAFDSTGMSMFKREGTVYDVSGDENLYHNIDGERQEMILRLAPAKAAVWLLAISLLLSACAGGNSNNGQAQNQVPQGSQTTSVAASQANATQEQAFPRTYTDGKGTEVTLTSQPQRIAVGHFAEMEFFFALGVPPVASPLATEILAEFEVTLGEEAAQADVVDLGEVMSPDLEKLLEVQPDLIIGSIGLHDDVYDSMNAIAPVVMLDLDKGWKGNLREYATIIGREDEAERYIDALSADMAAANEELLPFREQSVGFFRISGKTQFGAIGTSYYTYLFDTEEGLGFTAPDGYPDKWSVMSFEGLADMNPQYLVLIDYSSSYEQNIADFADHAVWQSLDAVKNNRVYFLDVAATTGGPYAIKHAVQSLLDSFTGQGL